MFYRTMLNFSPLRAVVTMCLLAGLLGAMPLRIVYLQTLGREQTIHRIDRQQHQSDVLPARRGTIFDRNGTLMAGTVEMQICFVDPKFILDFYSGDGEHTQYVEMDQKLGQLARILDKDFGQLSMQISDARECRYLKLGENLDAQTCSAIEQLKMPGIGFEPQSERFYPMGSLASHVLGETGADGHGLDGLELRFDKELAGIDGYKRILKDARREPIAVGIDDYRAPEHGQHLVLTIDANIQMFAEQQLAATCQKFRAPRGEVVVMDPSTGEVLALANYPTFNPQNIEDSTPEVRTNRAIVSPYEPGSVIKPFVAGPALQAHITRMDEVFALHGANYFTPYGRKISDVHGYDKLAFWDVLVKSSNIGMSMLGERMGNPKIHAALTGFGFGKSTGLELPGETNGRLNPLAKWTKYTTESCSTGYELMVTPLQLARGFCCYANGGRLVDPHLLKGRLDSLGNVVERTAVVPFDELPQAIDAQTSADVRRILCDVVVRGTASGSRSQYWNIFGKTGTAHIAEGHAYSQTRFNSSFIAGAPYENPRLVIALTIHDPQSSIHFGGAVAAPGAVHILEQSLAYLQAPHSPPLPLPPANIQALLYNFSPKVYDFHTAVLPAD
jgi:cell division protein FtsI (penicillin-binding protein 3)